MQRLAAIGALVGGVVSEMTGGKFENGAMTATISWAFNELGGRGESAQKELSSAQFKLQNSQFCEVMCSAAEYEASFESPLDFAKSIRDIGNPLRLGEHDFLPSDGFAVGFHYDTGLGKSYDMQYVLTGWALETQVVGSAGPLYGAYRVFGAGLGGLVLQGQSNINFTDPANLGGLNFGIFGARRFSSFSDFSNNACGCGL